jgi:hypothetical protein
MTPRARRFWFFIVLTAVAVGLCLLFPRVLAFAELAARELRYFWWLVLMLALGVWLAFFAGRKRG